MSQHWIYPVIGQRIRRRRKNLQLTQEALAPRLGMSRASLANIETGRQRLLVDQLYSVAEALNLTPGDLLPAMKSTETPAPEKLPLPKDLNAKQKEQIKALLSSKQPTGLPKKGTAT